jgi:hypothetical protein
MKSFDNILLSFPEMDMKVQQSIKGGDGTYTTVPVNQDPNSPSTSGLSTLPKYTPPPKIFTLADWLALTHFTGGEDSGGGGDGGLDGVTSSGGGGDESGSSSYGYGGDGSNDDDPTSYTTTPTSGGDDDDEGDDFDYAGYDIDTDPDSDTDVTPSGYSHDDDDPEIAQVNAFVDPTGTTDPGPYKGYLLGEPPPGYVDPNPGQPQTDILTFTDAWGKNWIKIPGSPWDTTFSPSASPSGDPTETPGGGESGEGGEPDYWMKSVVDASETIENAHTAIDVMSLTNDSLKEAAELAFKSKAMVLLGKATGAVSLYGSAQEAYAAYKKGDAVGVAWNGTKFIATSVFLLGGGEEVELAWNITSLGVDWVLAHTK